MNPLTRRSAWVLALALAAGGCRPTEDAQPVTEAVRAANVTSVLYREVNSPGSLVGEVAPRTESNLGFRTNGKVAERLVSVGDPVKAGEVLARLDRFQAENALEQARAAVASALAQKNNAEQTEQRQRELLGRGFTTQAAFDAALASANVARANLMAAEAALRDAQDGLDYMELKADAEGVITATAAEVGQVVAAGQTIVQMASTDLRDAVFQAPESVLRPEALKAPIKVSLLNDPAITADGKVRQISPAADPITRTFRVKVGLDNPPEAFRFGSAVRGQAQVPGAKLAALPLSALYDEGGKPAVWVADPSGKVSVAPVQVARFEANRILVSGGVPEGAKVVVAGIQRLRPGMTVRPVETLP